MRPIPPHRDAYGQEMWHCHQGESDYEIIERDDGFIDPGTALQYFRQYPDWPSHEREAIQHVRGRVLDIGCGAGRVALYLQQQGQKVLGIDNSPLAVKVARLRGVASVRVLDIRDVGTLPGRFASIVMYGNNFGLFGGRVRARRMLAAMHRITTPDARIIAAVADPYRTKDPAHLSYHRRNRERGRMGGQLRLRVRFRQFVGPWFDYLFASPDEVREIVGGTAGGFARLSTRLGPSTPRFSRRVSSPASRPFFTRNTANLVHPFGNTVTYFAGQNSDVI
jgi:SAM-dependent methyltransferase